MQNVERAEANLGLANGRIPPTWSVENDKAYPLRLFAEDLRLWQAATDIDAARCGPAVVLRITGAARTLLREVPVATLANGQLVPDPNQPGQMMLISGVEALIRILERRYGALDQETQVFTVSELMTFQRGHHESTDEMIARFDVILFKANAIAGVAYPPVIRAWVILTHLRIPRSAWPALLAPTLGMLPVNEDEYNNMIAYVRRNGHLHEARHADPARTIGQPYFADAAWQEPSASWPAQEPQNWPSSSYPAFMNDMSPATTAPSSLSLIHI